MKKKFLIAAGAVVLTTMGAFAGHLSAKTEATQLFYSSASGCHPLTGTFLSQSVLTTSTAAGSNQASIKTAGGTLTRKVFATSGCNQKVYFIGV